MPPAVPAAPAPATAAADSGPDDEVREELIETVKRFTRAEIMPIANQHDHEDSYPAELIEKARALLES